MPTLSDIGPYSPSMPTPPPCTPPWQSDSTAFTAATARRRMLRRNSSLSSLSSISSGSPDDIDELDWTEGELVAVNAAYADIVEQADCMGTPFVGPPPSQLTHNVARALCREDGWRHTLRNTRAKILECVKDNLQWQMDIEATPMQPDPEATPRRSKRLQRQNSMDVMPPRRDGATLAKLSSKLRNSETLANAKAQTPRRMTDSFANVPAAYPSPAPTPQRPARLTRTTSMATLGPVAEPASYASYARPHPFGRTNSATYATFDQADPALHGATVRPALSSPTLGDHLSTPFQSGFLHGMRPSTPGRASLHRTMSTLSLSRWSENGSDASMSGSPLSSSFASSNGSYFGSSYASSLATTAPSVRDTSENFLDPRYVSAGRGLKRLPSRSSLRSMSSSEYMRVEARYP